jgi:hypothetical protein
VDNYFEGANAIGWMNESVGQEKYDVYAREDCDCLCLSDACRGVVEVKRRGNGVCDVEEAIATTSEKVTGVEFAFERGVENGSCGCHGMTK